MQGKGRDRIGGSTTHMDGMGSFTAIGGLKAGEKSVTAFESEDCATALAVAKFKAFAKPGGSSYVVNDRIDDDDTLRNRFHRAGVRFRTFPIREGEAYLVPSGALHEFMNVIPCLSVAWNIMPHPANCEVAMRIAEASAEEAQAELGVNTDRSASAIEHAPPESMRERHAAWVIKTALEREILLRRRWASGPDSRSACSSGGGRGCGPSRPPTAESSKAAAEAAASHKLPADMWKKFLFMRPSGHYYDGHVGSAASQKAAAVPAATAAAAAAARAAPVATRVAIVGARRRSTGARAAETTTGKRTSTEEPRYWREPIRQGSSAVAPATDSGRGDGGSGGGGSGGSGSGGGGSGGGGSGGGGDGVTPKRRKGTVRASSSSFRSSVVATGTDGGSGSGSSGGGGGGDGDGVATPKRRKGTVRASSSSFRFSVVAPGTDGGSGSSGGGSGSGGGATVTVVKKRGRGRPRKVKPGQQVERSKEEEAAQPRIDSAPDEPSVEEVRARETADEAKRPVAEASASQDKSAPPETAPTLPATEAAAASMEDTSLGKAGGQVAASEDTSAPPPPPPRQVEEAASPKVTSARGKAGKAKRRVVGVCPSSSGISAPPSEEEQEEDEDTSRQVAPAATLRGFSPKARVRRKGDGPKQGDKSKSRVSKATPSKDVLAPPEAAAPRLEEEEEEEEEDEEMSCEFVLEGALKGFPQRASVRRKEDDSKQGDDPKHRVASAPASEDISAPPTAAAPRPEEEDTPREVEPEPASKVASPNQGARVRRKGANPRRRVPGGVFVSKSLSASPGAAAAPQSGEETPREVVPVAASSVVTSPEARVRRKGDNPRRRVAGAAASKNVTSVPPEPSCKPHLVRTPKSSDMAAPSSSPSRLPAPRSALLPSAVSSAMPGPSVDPRVSAAAATTSPAAPLASPQMAPHPPYPTLPLGDDDDGVYLGVPMVMMPFAELPFAGDMAPAPHQAFHGTMGPIEFPAGGAQAHGALGSYAGASPPPHGYLGPERPLPLGGQSADDFGSCDDPLVSLAGMGGSGDGARFHGGGDGGWCDGHGDGARNDEGGGDRVGYDGGGAGGARFGPDGAGGASFGAGGHTARFGGGGDGAGFGGGGHSARVCGDALLGGDGGDGFGKAGGVRENVRTMGTGIGRGTAGGHGSDQGRGGGEPPTLTPVRRRKNNAG
ncbi:unnamed protein product, partial [Ectocarpus fasciculatus]